MASVDEHKKFLVACEIGDLETVEGLFDKFVNNDYILQMRNLVVLKGNLNVLEYFYQRGVDMNEVYYAKTPLIIAARTGWVDVIDFLLEMGEDINLQNFNGDTALMIASMCGNIDIADRLLETGQCNVNHKDIWGDTVLFCVVKRGHLGVVDKLLVYGANYYHVNKNGENLLHCAILSENIDMLQRVMSLRPDVNHQDNYGWTPLMYAVRIGKGEMIKILMEHGADPMIEDKNGKTASDFTRDSEIKNLLMKK